MISQLKEIDKWLLLKVNGFHTDWADFFMYHVSERFALIPFYLLIIFLLVKYYKRDSFLIILFTFITFGIADLISVHFFKNVFQRYRPCHNGDLEGMLHSVNNACGGMYTFVSSHATNSFSVVAFLTPFLKDRIPYLWYATILWAVLLCYSRVYLGVHYPIDVTAGALLGCLIGFIMSKLLMQLRKRPLDQVV